MRLGLYKLATLTLFVCIWVLHQDRFSAMCKHIGLVGLVCLCLGNVGWGAECSSVFCDGFDLFDACLEMCINDC